MERVAVDGLELDVELTGSGDVIVLIHWGLCAAWAEPLLAEPELAGGSRSCATTVPASAAATLLAGPSAWPVTRRTALGSCSGWGSNARTSWATRRVP
jgi:hypothetical protein